MSDAGPRVDIGAWAGVQRSAMTFDAHARRAVSGSANLPPGTDAVSDLLDPRTRLERELLYYRRECNDLGARLLRLQEEQSQAHRDARRSRTIVRLVREVYRLADLGGSAAEIRRATLDLIVENAICDRAMLLGERPIGGGRFTCLCAIGHPEPPEGGVARIRRPPPFLYTADRLRRDPAGDDMAALLGLPYLLWSYDARTGHALLIGNRSQVNINRPFEPGDQEFIETALSVYLDALYRQAAAGAPDRVPEGDAIRGDAGPAAAEAGGLTEAEIREGLNRGGRIIGFTIVEQGDGTERTYLAYVNASWSRGYRVLRTFRNRSDRRYRDLDRLLQFARVECGFAAPVRIEPRGTAIGARGEAPPISPAPPAEPKPPAGSEPEPQSLPTTAEYSVA